jgi:hypothetical protein
VEFTATKSRNYAVLRLKNADMGRKVQETNAYDEAKMSIAKVANHHFFFLATFAYD